MPYTVLQLKNRISELLNTPLDRINIADMANNVLPRDMVVPADVRVLDAWTIGAAEHDIMDMVLAGQPTASFVIKINQRLDT